MNDVNRSSPILGEGVFSKREEGSYSPQRTKDPFAWTPLPGGGEETKDIRFMCEHLEGILTLLSYFDSC